MLTQQQIPALVDATAYDSTGDKIGAIKQVYLDDRTEEPQFATVHTGLLGMKETFVPLAGAELRGDRVVVPVDKAQVKDAPSIDPDRDDGGLTPGQAAELYRHYRLPAQSGGTHDDYATDDDATPGRGTDAGRHSDRDDDAMTRSEERVNVGTETHEAGRARLRKYVVTEQVQQTVPVTREEVRIEREPITEANRGPAFSGPDISEAEHEVTLHAEKPVVEKEAVPVERVRLGTETVTEQKTVDSTVRKEKIDTDGIDERR
ncbi:DUF2382 domain-containing protein [Cryptosporangium aurantiacum]|uniref:Conserved domain-containing protein n=1 Tax=Cryptosporangium aurantiacum TaxID=134849 RepID=A0A1M7PR75_9ACTN|nr:PRC and DUF2382 domain-containing protein [Cryptosporangium aurantiacum]SHN19915.1 conserved domain-containing protein [Cryptosporangium aurantiacum]